MMNNLTNPLASHNPDVTQETIQQALRNLGLSDKAVCVHSSLRSFGRVQGGARTVVQAFVDEGCTLMVPSFSYDYAITPPPHLRPLRNGWDYGYDYGDHAPEGFIYSPDSQTVDADMGAIPAAVVTFPPPPAPVRGDHPLNSFSAIGPLAKEMIAQQAPLNVFAPLQALVEVGGYVLLIGVGLDRMTLLHYAEQVAGREPFRRWAYDHEGEAQMVQAGSCSDGFEQLRPILRPWQRETMVGQSTWHLFPAPEALRAATEAMGANPALTHCGREDCERCHDALLGGPILA